MSELLCGLLLGVLLGALSTCIVIIKAMEKVTR